MSITAVRHVLDEMAAHHGVITRSRARSLGLDARSERRAIAAGVLGCPAPGVLTAVGAPESWERRVRIATGTIAAPVLAHRSACRVHGVLDGSDRDPIEVMVLRGRHPARIPRVWHHVTRGPRHGTFDDHVVDIDGVPALGLPAALALLAPVAGAPTTTAVLRRSLEGGLTVGALRDAADLWQQRGRPGPTTLHLLLDEIEGARLDDAWIDHLGFVLRRDHGWALQRDVVIGPTGSPTVVDLAVVDHRLGVRRVAASADDTVRPGPDGWRIVEVSWRDRDRRAAVGRTIARLASQVGERRSAG